MMTLSMHAPGILAPDPKCRIMPEFFLIPFSLDFFIKSRFSQTSLSWTKKRTNKKVATWKNLGKTFSWESALWVPFQRAQTSTSGSKSLEKKRIHYRVNRPFNLHPEKRIWGCHLRFSRAWTWKNLHDRVATTQIFWGAGTWFFYWFT